MAAGLFACVSPKNLGFTSQPRFTSVLAHTSVGRYPAKKTRWIFLFHSLHQWGTPRKTKVPKRRRDSISCRTHSLPSTAPQKTHTTVRIRRNRDPVRLHSTHDLGLHLPHFRKNRVTVRTQCSPRNQFHDKALYRSTRLTPARLPVHITAATRFLGMGTDRSAMSLDTWMGIVVMVLDNSMNTPNRSLSRSTSRIAS